MIAHILRNSLVLVTLMVISSEALFFKNPFPSVTLTNTKGSSVISTNSDVPKAIISAFGTIFNPINIPQALLKVLDIKGIKLGFTFRRRRSTMDDEIVETLKKVQETITSADGNGCFQRFVCELSTTEGLTTYQSTALLNILQAADIEKSILSDSMKSFYNSIEIASKYGWHENSVEQCQQRYNLCKFTGRQFDQMISLVYLYQI